MKVTVIQTVIGAHGTVTKGLVQGLEDWELRGGEETIQSTAFLRSARKESWRPKVTCCHSDSSGKPSANAGVKNSRMSKIIIISSQSVVVHRSGGALGAMVIVVRN